MKNALIINTHHPYESSAGQLNASLVELANACLAEKGYELQNTRVTVGYGIQEEVEKHLWANCIIVQGPVNWMGFPWSFKKYQDEVYSAAGGLLFDGDGRQRAEAGSHYGSGGLGQGKKYMFSLTFNAPREAFGDPGQYLFAGKDVDDLFFPSHMNFRFMGMEPLETFVCYDVHKNPDIENDFARYREHLARLF